MTLIPPTPAEVKAGRTLRALEREQKCRRHDMRVRAGTWRHTGAGQPTLQGISIYATCRKCGYTPHYAADLRIDGIPDFEAFAQQIAEQMVRLIEKEEPK